MLALVSHSPYGLPAGLLTASLCPYAGQGAEVLQSIGRYLVKVTGNKRGLGTRASSLQALGMCELSYPVVTPVFCILRFSHCCGGLVPTRTCNYTKLILLCQGDLARFWSNFAVVFAPSGSFFRAIFGAQGLLYGLDEGMSRAI